MFDALRKRWSEGRDGWRGVRRFESLARSERRVAFYAETRADWAHLGPVVHALEASGVRVLRVCSDSSDPSLRHPDGFFVGFGSARTVLFRTIEVDAFVMTLSDLDRFHLKRSVHPVHYFYVFHSMASTHRVYRERAFDAYDTIFCVGPHHLEEIRRTEAEYGLRAKELVPHGYGRLDVLMEDLATRDTGGRHDATRVLIAPSWGESSLVRHGLDALIQALLDAGFEVAARFHPMTERHHPRLAADLVARFGNTGRYRFDPDVGATRTLLDADVMISEWSGAALEYAFARLRPVIFVDTPPKIHNPEHARIPLPALEETIRTGIGSVVAPGDHGAVVESVHALVRDAAAWRDRIAAQRERVVFNPGRSGDAAAVRILGTLRPMRRPDV